MRKEIENWWKQALKDLDSAQKNFEIKEYYLVAFLCEQAVEKALKALILEKQREIKVDGHSLVHLGKTAKIPESFLSGLRELGPQYVISRYPDTAGDVPFELYDEENAKRFLQIAKSVIEWIRKQLN